MILIYTRPLRCLKYDTKEHLKFSGGTLTLFLPQQNTIITMSQQGLPQGKTMSITLVIFVSRV